MTWRSLGFSGMRWGIKPLRVALMTIVLAALVAPAGALAAPPANDNFADREVLGPGFPLDEPIEVPRSNVEATKEDGEFIPGLSPAGHSIWFEWEAEEDSWVTIGACDSEFPTILAVFTGTELNALTPAVSGNGNEGPDCPFTQRQFTFKAVSGTNYVIAVDGNNFHFPEGPKPITQGPITLQIEETPPPPNDDFADAEPLAARIDEEPGGNRIFFANAQGHNWTATTEPGESSYGPDAGASVWFEWTVPENGTYFIGGPCCVSQLEWSLFSGDSFDDLSQLFLGTGSTQMALTAGTTLRVAVFGPPDAGTGEPTMGSFNFFVRANLPALPKPMPGGGGATVTPPPPPPQVAPQTKILGRTLKPRIGLAKFRFTSTVAGSSFRCKLDKGPFRHCKPPRTYRRLRPGRHTFKVKAVSASGLADPTAVVSRFSIAKPRPKR